MRSWFSELIPACTDFYPEGRILWVEIEGVPLKLWSDKTFSKIVARWGELLEMDDSDENCFHSRRLCVLTKAHLNVFENFKITFKGRSFWIRAKEVSGWVPELVDDFDDDVLSENESLIAGDKLVNDDKFSVHSDIGEVPETDFVNSSEQNGSKSTDPFDIYSLLNKQKAGKMDRGESNTPSHPPGFTPDDMGNISKGNGDNEDVFNDNMGDEGGQEANEDVLSKGDNEKSASFDRFKHSESPKAGGSFVGLMEEVVKVGLTMGYNMDGVVNNLSEIIGSHGVSSVNR